MSGTYNRDDGGEYSDTVLSGSHSGMAGGAAIGNSFMPGWGAAIGAGVGAIGGLFTGWRKAEREKNAREAREKAWREAQTQLAADRYQMNRQSDAAFRGGYSPANKSLGKMYGGENLDLSKSPLTYIPGKPPPFGEGRPSDWGPDKWDPEDKARWDLWQSGQITDEEYFGSAKSASAYRDNKRMGSAREKKAAAAPPPKKPPQKKGGGSSKAGKKPVTYQP